MAEGAPPLPKRNALPDPESWERRRALPFPRSFFQLQYDFTKIIAEKNGQELFNAIHNYAPIIGEELNDLEAHEGQQLVSDPDTVVDFAYNKYVKRDVEGENEPIPYNDGSRFGCFMYDYPKHAPERIYIHFVNAEFDTDGPLSREKIAERERELHDVFKDIKERNPKAKTVHGNSWLYSLDAYKRLFPASYTNSLRADEGYKQWQAGTMLWGQFLDSEGGLKSDLANVLLERARNLEPGGQNDLLTPPLTSAFYAEAPIEDFYKKYGVE